VSKQDISPDILGINDVSFLVKTGEIDHLIALSESTVYMISLIWRDEMPRYSWCSIIYAKNLYAT